MVELTERVLSTANPNVMSAMTILLTALVTYGLRLGGLLLADRLPNSPAFKRFMDALPGTVLVALVAPGLLQEGLWGFVSAGCIVLVFRVTKNLFIAMVVGMVIIAGVRALS